MSQTIVEKLAQAHKADGPDRPWRAGDFVSIRPRHVMTHDNTAAVMKKFAAIGSRRIHDPRQLVFALDHDIQNQSEENQNKYRSIEAFAREHGVDFYPAGTGIGHQLMVERGYVVPNSFVVASDSHSNMYGALGAIGTPIVRTDAAAIWATGEFWWQIPRTVQVVLEGELPSVSSGKDVIISLCGLYKNEVLNAAVEFTGSGVATLSMDARLAISNMSTEWGALVAWFPCDDTTLTYMRRVHESQGNSRVTDDNLSGWESDPPRPDPDAVYASRIVLNLTEVTPQISGPDTVQVTQALEDLEQKRVPIQKAYLLSCTNSRVEDLESAARVISGKKVAPSVKLYLAAASQKVQAEAERRGVWQAIVDAGAITLPPGCGPCIGLGTGLLEPGEVGISATNRNFKGRMGSKEAQCYLASPAVVASSAVAGYVASPSAMNGSGVIPSEAVDLRNEQAVDLRKKEVVIPSERPPISPPDFGAQGGRESGDLQFGPARHYEDISSLATLEPEQVKILPGFPSQLRGRLIFIPKDNLNTDAIYAGKYTYAESMTPARMAEVVFDNYDPQFAGCVHAGDVVVGGFNFGTGSSREQAVTALKAKAIPLVIAGSFSQTYLRNAFNNGFLCIEVPALIRRLREQFAAAIASGGKTIITGEEIAIDFTACTLTWRDLQYTFPALGSVPQSLVIAGGIESLVRRRLEIG